MSVPRGAWALSLDLGGRLTPHADGPGSTAVELAHALDPREGHRVHVAEVAGLGRVPQRENARGALGEGAAQRCLDLRSAGPARPPSAHPAPTWEMCWTAAVRGSSSVWSRTVKSSPKSQNNCLGWGWQRSRGH